MNELIKKYEGLSLKAYKCPAGIWTIGYGTTANVKEGDVITLQEAESYLQDYLRNNIKLPEIPLTDNQKEALYSLIYNIGQTAFDKSSLKKAILNNDIKEIFKNWDWISADNKPLKGLAKRRAEELYKFFS